MDDEILSIATDTPNGELLDVIFMDPLPIAAPPAGKRRRASFVWGGPCRE